MFEWVNKYLIVGIIFNNNNYNILVMLLILNFVLLVIKMVWIVFGENLFLVEDIFMRSEFIICLFVKRFFVFFIGLG